MVRKFFYGDHPFAGKPGKQSGGKTSGKAKVFGLNPKAFIERKMAEQQAKSDEKPETGEDAGKKK